MSVRTALQAAMLRLLQGAMLGITALAPGMPASAQAISTQAITEPDPGGFIERFFSPDGQWVCVALDSLRCAPSNASSLAILNHPLQQAGSLLPWPRFLPGTSRILYPLEDGAGRQRVWTVIAGQPQSAVDLTPQWPTADIADWLVSDQGDIVLFVEDGGDREIHLTRVDTPGSFVEIGANVAVGAFTGPAQFAADGQAVFAELDDRIWRVPLDAGPAVPMSQPGAFARPEFDERGGHLYFRAAVSGNRVDLFRVSLAGGVAQPLNLNATHSSTTRPFFSPDGSFACFFERRVDYDLACADLRDVSPQVVGFGTVAGINWMGSGEPTGQHLIASDNRTLYGTCDECGIFLGLYRARVDGSVPVTVLTGSSLQVRELRDLPDLGRVLFRVLDENTSTFSWQSTTYDFTQPVDYPFTSDFLGFDATSDRLAFLTDVNPLTGVEIQLASVRSDGSDDLALTGGVFSNGILDAFATPDGSAVIVEDNYLILPGPSEGARLSRVRIDGTDFVVLGNFPRTGAQTPLIYGTVLSPGDPYGTASGLIDDSLRSEVITYSGAPAPLFRDGFEP